MSEAFWSDSGAFLWNFKNRYFPKIFGVFGFEIGKSFLKLDIIFFLYLLTFYMHGAETTVGKGCRSVFHLGRSSVSAVFICELLSFRPVYFLKWRKQIGYHDFQYQGRCWKIINGDSAGEQSCGSRLQSSCNRHGFEQHSDDLLHNRSSEWAGALGTEKYCDFSCSE